MQLDKTYYVLEFLKTIYKIHLSFFLETFDDVNV